MPLKICLLLAAAAVIMASPGQAQAYDRGAFYYGSDCGGNSVAGTFSVHPAAKTATGVILGGGAASAIGQKMNCDDRRHAILSYRDGLQGRLGQLYSWFNPDGGGSGSFTPVRSYSENGSACRDFREVYNTGSLAVSSKGTACLQSDGNWHIP